MPTTFVKYGQKLIEVIGFVVVVVVVVVIVVVFKLLYLAQICILTSAI